MNILSVNLKKVSGLIIVFVAMNLAMLCAGIRFVAWGSTLDNGLPQDPQQPIAAQDTTPKKAAKQDTISVADTMSMSMPALDTTSSALKEIKREKASKESGGYEQGLGHRKAGEFESAAASFEAVLRDDPNNVKALVNLARTYVDLNRLEKASETINRALAADSTNADAYSVRGRIMNLNGEAQIAIESYQKAIALDPGNPFAKNNLAFIYIQSQRFNDALPLIEQAIAQKNDVAYFHNNLGIVYAALGERQKAVDAFQAALVIDPSNEKAKANLERAQKALDEIKPEEASSL